MKRCPLHRVIYAHTMLGPARSAGYFTPFRGPVNSVTKHGPKTPGDTSAEPIIGAEWPSTRNADWSLRPRDRRRSIFTAPIGLGITCSQTLCFALTQPPAGGCGTSRQ